MRFVAIVKLIMTLLTHFTLAVAIANPIPPMYPARGMEAGVDFLSAIDGEIRAIEDSLAGDARYEKLKELKRLRRLYEMDNAHPTSQGLSADEIDRAHPRRAARKITPERQAALDQTRNYLLTKVEPIKTAEIYDFLKHNGVHIGGADPLNNLSALLSTSGRFNSNGRAGWTLKKNEAAGTPSESAPTASETELFK